MAKRVAILVILVTVACVGAAGCDAPSPSPASMTDAGRSPNASISPAPLATGASDFATDGDAAAPEPPSAPDAPTRLPPTDALATAGPLPSDSPPFPREEVEPGPAKPKAPTGPSGVTIEGVFRWRDVPTAPHTPEVSTEGHREAQRSATPTVRADLAEMGRMRFELTGNGFLLPAHTEIRARSDRFGHVVVWPDGAAYRVVPFGALRTMIGERRVDVMPLTTSLGGVESEGHRLGLRVIRVDLSSSVASLRVELGRVPEAGEGGLLLCRMLVELAGIDPRTSTCQAGEVPLFASYAWQEGGGITFEVTSMAKRTDLALSSLLVPPSNAEHHASGLPAVPHGIVLSREAFASLRTAAVPVSAARDNTLPGEGFVADNRSDRMMMLFLDGIPAVWMPPLTEQYVVGPLRGRYSAEWRTFLGDKVAPALGLEVPARIVYGGATSSTDGGTP